MTANSFLTKEEQQVIVSAIEQAEKDSSGEIRLHIESNCTEDILDRAAYLFAKLKMHKTELRNGVLIYLAIKDKKFAILGDVGINSKVPAGFWDEIKDKMTTCFKENRYVDGLTEGIRLTGEKLKTFFPLQPGDINELSNDISFGK
jgi:uncharacterized membrane protein